MLKGLKFIFIMMILANIIFINCVQPTADTDKSESIKPEIDSIWAGQLYSETKNELRNISITVYKNNTVSGRIGCSGFTMTFEGVGNLTGPSVYINGSGAITIPSVGMNTFTIVLTGTVTGSNFTGTWSVDFSSWIDEVGIINLTVK